MNSYYSEEELQNLNFKSIGNNNKISRNTKFYNTKNITIGNNCRIDDNCIISSSNKGIIFGDFVHLSNNVSISGNALIKLEDFSGLSSKVSIFGSTDDYSGKSMTNPCVGSFNECCTNITNGDIIIGKHAIVGCNSVILPGCSIASGVSIGALSLVNRKITKIGIYQGNPIEYIKDKDDNYLKLEEKYFSKYYNKTTNTIINDKNETKTNKNEILTKINNLLNIDITTKNNEKILNIGVDSLTFIQLQNIINKNYNITIDYNCTINDILEICDTKNKSTNSKLVNEINESKLVNEINESKLVNQVNDSNSSITIIGLGHKLSSKEIKNDFYEKIVDTNHEWIKQRTGIERKFILDENETLEEIIIDSSLKAIQSANIKSTEIDLLILASSTPEDLFGDASKIAYKIGATNAFAFDIRNACNGFITSMITAENFLKDEKKYKVALVIGADCLSRYVDWNDRKSNILFGDGAGCVILKKSQGKNNGILDNLLKTDGEYNSILNIYSKTEKSTINDINLLNNNYNKLTLDGIGVFNFVINFMPDSIEKFLSSNNINKNQIKYFVLHQANIRIIEEISNKLNVNKEKFVYNIDKVGNTSAASIPILLDDLYNNNKLEKDDLLLISSFGAGMSAGMILFKWSMEKKNLNNKVALVTGGTKGIGKELAIKLKNKGYITIVCSRNNNNNLQDIEHYKADISKLDDIKNLYEFIYKKYGRLDILINNAGVEGPENPFTITDIEDIQNCININLMGTILLTKNMINLLKDSKGIIINISSIAAGDNISNCFKRTIYSMTKSAIGTFTRGIAGELKNICNVYSINPPFVDTDLLDRVVNKYNINKEMINSNGTIKNCNKLIKPNDISNIVSLLIDGKTRYRSGDEILILDSNKTSYMKYLYEKMDDRDNNKFEINDIENHPIYNLCFFQGQGLEINIDIDLIKQYIELNNYDKLIIKITKYSFNEILDLNNKEPINTHYQQLIIFIASYILFCIQKYYEPLFFKNIGYMAGYSLGEITALVCSEKISFEDGLKLVYTRGFYMHLISIKSKTTMITVKGLSVNDIKNKLSPNIFLCININKNINIIGGDKGELEIFKEKNANILVNDLLVEGSYHTPYYKEVADELYIVLNNIKYTETNIKVYSNFNSIIYNKDNYKELIKKQVYNTVDWFNTNNLLKMEDIGDIKEINISNNYLLKQFNSF